MNGVMDMIVCVKMCVIYSMYVGISQDTCKFDSFFNRKKLQNKISKSSSAANGVQEPFSSEAHEGY